MAGNIIKKLSGFPAVTLLGTSKGGGRGVFGELSVRWKGCQFSRFLLSLSLLVKYSVGNSPVHINKGVLEERLDNLLRCVGP